MRLSSFLFLLSAACAISTLAHTLSNISAHRSNGRGISARSLSKHGSSAGVNPRKGTGSSYGTGTGIGTGSGSSCTFTSFPQYVAGKSKCASIVLQDLKVPAGQTLELAGLPKGATVTFAGKTTFGYKPWVGPLISASGSITITGAPGHVIDCEGRNWWDNRGDVGSKKAKFLFAHQLNNAKIVGLNILNTPIQAISIFDSHYLTLDHITLDNSEGDKNGARNTDFIDIGSSSHITISNCHAHTQDDCLAVNSGSEIHFTNNVCENTHGISVGSVGGRPDNKVDGVYVSDSHVINAMHGIRIKTVSGAKCLVNNVQFTDVTLENISMYGVLFAQNYQNGRFDGQLASGCPLTNIKLSGITGTVGQRGTPVYIATGQGAASNWEWNDVDISGGKPCKICKNVPEPATC